MEATTRAERTIIAENMRDLACASDEDRKAWRFKVEADRFEKCGEEVVLFECPEDHLQLYSRTRCRSRICDHCGTSFYGRIVNELRDAVKCMLASRRKGFYPVFLTLTVQKARYSGPNGDAMPGRDDIRRIYRESADFFRLFAGRYKGKFTRSGKVREDRKHFLGAGSISTVEVGSDNNNLHVHAVVYFPYTPMSTLKDAWRKITGDSHVVNIKRIHSARQAANYLLKYITKPPQTDSYRRIAEYAWMIKGSRRLRTSGLFYNSIRVKRHESLKCRCPFCHGRIKLYGISDDAGLEDRAAWPLWELLRRSERAGRPLLLLWSDAVGGLTVYSGGGTPEPRNDLPIISKPLQKKPLDTVKQFALL